jgi:hypothetical protein
MDWLLTYADPNLDWPYALSTLLVRFIGVFVVMFVMQVAMQASALAVRWWENREARAPAPLAAPSAPAAAAPVSMQGVIDDASVAAAALAVAASDEAVVAAVAAALAIEARPSARGEGAAGSPSPWAVAGRLQQLHRLPR